jgi:hypothetical protein
MSKTCRWIEARLHSFEQHPFLKTFHCLLLILSLVSLVFLTRSLIVNFDGSIRCVWLQWGFWSGILYGCLTLWVISYNLMKFIDVEATRAVGDLRIKLHDDDNMEIHKLLMASDDEEEGNSILREIKERKSGSGCKESLSIAGGTESIEDNPEKSTETNVDGAKLFNYLGTIELGSIMLQKRLVTFDEFFNQFGYRVQNIANCTALMEYVRSDGNKDYYDNLLYVIDEFHRRKMI